MYIQAALAVEIYDFTAELGERFPNLQNAQVIENINEAFMDELPRLIQHTEPFAETLITAYDTQSPNAALEHAFQIMPTRFNVLTA